MDKLIDHSLFGRNDPGTLVKKIKRDCSQPNFDQLFAGDNFGDGFFDLDSTASRKMGPKSVQWSKRDNIFSSFEEIMDLLREREKGDLTKFKESSRASASTSKFELSHTFFAQSLSNDSRQEISDQLSEAKATQTNNQRFELVALQKQEIISIRRSIGVNTEPLNENPYRSAFKDLPDLLEAAIQTSHQLCDPGNSKSKSSEPVLKLKEQLANALLQKENLEARYKIIFNEWQKKSEDLELWHASEKQNIESSYRSKVSELESKIASTEQSCHMASLELEALRKKLNANENERIAMNEQIQELKGNVRVFCRLKPLAEKSRSVFDIPDQGNHIRMLNLLNPSGKSRRYLFDKVFKDQDQQTDVFKEIKPFVQSAYDGNSVTIFAYGQTGSGKTYTLEGSAQNQGILPRSLQHIIDAKTADDSLRHDVEIFISCLEIYNERLIDLLNDDFDSNTELKIQIIANAVVIPGLKDVSLGQHSQIDEVCAKATKNRNVEKTAFNERSSRSHCVYRIQIKKRLFNGKTVSGLLNIIDLAGSERTSLGIDEKANSEKAKKIQKEATFINKSLTTLGRIMRLLKEQKATGVQTSLPVRETKLTRILQDCLGDSCQTLLFINVCQEEANLGQTRESLNFATFTAN